MKVLIISAYFPPANTMGAIRVGKFARYLVEHGCDVRVVSAHDPTVEQTLPIEINKNHVIQTKWLDIHSFLRLSLKRNSTKEGKLNKIKSSGILWKFYDLFRTFFHWPDRHSFWYFPACKAGREWLLEWKPDVIYASAWPVTSLLVGAKLSREFKIPWIAELRDLWVDNHYLKAPFWRNYIDRIIEKRTLKTARLIVTVSDPFSDILRKKFAAPVIVVKNGFDPEDSVISDSFGDKEILTITYTGMIYPGRRDPSPLFEALKQLGPLAKRVRVNFYGSTLPWIPRLIDSYGLSEYVKVHSTVPHHQALKIQAESDILLLLMWNTPEEKGVYTGKLFEYLGARRPILLLGQEKGVVADLIRSRHAGSVSNAPTMIANCLKEWIEEKHFYGKIQDLDISVRAGLSHAEQFDNLLPKIKSIAHISLSKPKVAIITKMLNIGGSEKHLIQILPHLSKKFDITVFVIHSGGILEQKLIDSNIHVSGPPGNLNSWLQRFYMAFRIAIFAFKEPDSIAHFFLPEAYILGGICCSVAGMKKTIMSRRSLNLYQKNQKILAKIEKMLHKRMHSVVGNSQAVVQDLINEGVSKSHVKLIYNGVNRQQFTDEEKIRERHIYREKLGIAEDALGIVTVANLISYKGHSDLITALGLIAPELKKSWFLLLAGRDDGIQSQLEKLVDSLNLTEHVLFLGQCDNVESLYAASDISVQPSHQEGFSNSIIEGMAAGLPIIATSVGGNTEAVLHEVTGLIVPPHSPSTLGSALSILINNPHKRKAYGEAARQRVEESFSIEKCIKEYEDLYRSVAS